MDEFIHRFVPGASGGFGLVLLLLHGTGGNENDLLNLGASLAPGAALLSPRGKILENGVSPRFFRRLSEGVFDEKDLILRTRDLAHFVETSAEDYGFDVGKVVAVGLSNGANIAASVLLLFPGLLSGAVLFRAMVPFRTPTRTTLAGRPILLAAGQHDPLVPRENTLELAEMLEQSGARVSLQWSDTGHQLASTDLEAANAWFKENYPGRE